MTNSRRGDLVAAIALFALGTVILLSVRRTPEVPVEDPLGPYGLPRVIAIGLIAVAVAIALQAWWAAVRRTGSATVESADRSDAEAVDLDPAAEAVADRRRLYGALTIAATIGYVLLLPVLGFVVASVLFGLALLPVLGARNLRAVIAVPAGAVALLWLLFVYSLDVDLPTFLGR